MFYRNRLREIREAQRISQKQLGDLLHIRENAYSQYETEYVIIPLKHLNTLCNYFNCSLDYLFGFTDEYNYQVSNKEIDLKFAGQRLKEFRKENKLTQVKLATFLNTVHPVITNYEKGKHLISTPFLYQICQKYHISADYLLGKTEEPKYL